MLRRKNKLMRAGRIEEAGSLAERIGKDITRHGKSRLGKMNGKTKSKDLWAAVRQVTGRRQTATAIDGITAESLNDHYSAISTDDTYISPHRICTTTTAEPKYITEWQVFQIIDHLQSTATGLDGLPAWFIRLEPQYSTNQLLIYSIYPLPPLLCQTSGSKP